MIEVLCDGPATTSGSSGRGIAGMKERVGLVGGRLEVGPGVGQGFNVRAWLPFDLESGGENTA
jgi:signal transduction histidine kinase